MPVNEENLFLDKENESKVSEGSGNPLTIAGPSFQNNGDNLSTKKIEYSK